MNIIALKPRGNSCTLGPVDIQDEGSQPKGHNMNKLMVALLVVFAVLSLACEPTNLSESGGNDNWIQVQPPQIQIGQFGNQYIVGSVKNNTDRLLSYAQISCQVISNGVQIADALDNTNGVQPQGTWQYRAILIEPVTASTGRIECQASGF